MALYVYALTRSSHPLELEGLTGVGGSAPLRAVESDGLCAVVGEAPAEVSMARGDLEAHHRVQEELWRQGVTLPLGFGFVADDEDAVRGVLEQNARPYAERLDALTGRSEFNVKCLEDEQAALRRTVAESGRVRELNEATRDGGGTYEQRVELGQLIVQEMQARQAGLAGTVLGALRPHAVAEHLSEPSKQYFANASYLVDDERADAFRTAADEVAKELPEGVEVRVRGPLPPYSFA
ncbi:GvpL/GvpF family gas vesicle protein [Streptomyces sp. enrichment culture]|uniref:GvpL/GvpF family gas vesicle protein n=1 Tax=Streptomyces sp. enrichment culture TaxID=1795815 RepID=UPI003F5798A2